MRTPDSTVRFGNRDSQNEGALEGALHGHAWNDDYFRGRKLALIAVIFLYAAVFWIAVSWVAKRPDADWWLLMVVFFVAYLLGVGCYIVMEYWVAPHLKALQALVRVVVTMAVLYYGLDWLDVGDTRVKLKIVGILLVFYVIIGGVFACATGTFV